MCMNEDAWKRRELKLYFPPFRRRMKKKHTWILDQVSDGAGATFWGLFFFSVARGHFSLWVGVTGATDPAVSLRSLVSLLI